MGTLTLFEGKIGVQARDDKRESEGRERTRGGGDARTRTTEEDQKRQSKKANEDGKRKRETSRSREGKRTTETDRAARKHKAEHVEEFVSVS